MFVLTVLLQVGGGHLLADGEQRLPAHQLRGEDRPLRAPMPATFPYIAPGSVVLAIAVSASEAVGVGRRGKMRAPCASLSSSKPCRSQTLLYKAAILTILYPGNLKPNPLPL